MLLHCGQNYAKMSPSLYTGECPSLCLLAPPQNCLLVVLLLQDRGNINALMYYIGMAMDSWMAFDCDRIEDRRREWGEKRSVTNFMLANTLRLTDGN